MDEQLRLDLIQNELTDLFELQRGQDGFYNCPTFAYTSPDMKQWVTNPCTLKGNGRRIPSKAGYERMLKSLGREERFSMAASPRTFDTTAWLSCEWDFTDVTPDEHFVKYAMDNDLWTIITRGVQVHWKFTGNRSVHLDVFLSSPVSKVLGARLLSGARHLLGAEHADKTNLTQCMRLPFSRHAKTNGLCRYAGCHNEDDLCRYIKHIERDDADEQSITNVCEQMEDYLSIHAPTVLSGVDTTPPMQEAKTHGIGGVVTHSRTEDISPPTDDQLRVWLGRVNQSPHLLRHPRRSEFLGYIEHGIPQGEFNRVIFEDKGAFPQFVMVMVGVKQDAHDYMKYLACRDVEDAARRTSRMGRLDYVFTTFFTSWQDCDSSFMPVEQLNAFDWLAEFIGKIRVRFDDRFKHKRLVNNLIQVTQYCLLLLFRHPEGATIAVSDVEHKLLISKKTAIRHLRTLREDFPVLTVKSHANHAAHLATDYVLNETFVECVLGYRIAQELTGVA